jgi:hypothetical protein
LASSILSRYGEYHRIWVKASDSELCRIATIVAALPRSLSALSDANTLTLDEAISAAAPINASATQYWLIEPSPSALGLYTISHFMTKQYLVLGATSTVFSVALQTKPPGSEGLWRISSQRMGGFAIVNSSRPNQVLGVLPGTAEIGCLNFIEDSLAGSHRLQRWQFSRSGLVYPSNSLLRHIHTLFAQAIIFKINIRRIPSTSLQLMSTPTRSALLPMNYSRKPNRSTELEPMHISSGTSTKAKRGIASITNIRVLLYSILALMETP